MLGFSGSGGAKLPGSGTGQGYNPPAGKKVIRQADFKSQGLKDTIRNQVGNLRAWHKERFKNEKTGKTESRVVRDVFTKNRVEHISNINGQRVVEKDYSDNILETVKRGTKSGQTVSSWKRAIGTQHELTSVAKDGTRRVYHISGDGANREKRKTLETLYDPKGPSPEEVAAQIKKQERLKRINIFQTQRSRDEEPGMADKLKSDKSGKAYLASKKSRDGRKITAQDIGAKERVYSVSASPKSASASAASQPSGGGFAGSDDVKTAASIGEGIGVKAKEQEGEDKKTMVDYDFYKKKQEGKKGPGSFDNNLFSDRTGTDG